MDYNNYSRPALQLSTNRGLLKYILLGIITVGIYPTVIFVNMVDDLNIVASRYDGKKTMNLILVSMLAPITLGIYPLVWIHRFCNRISDELKRRNLDYSFSATDFWLWGVLGYFIIVGPFVYMYKLLKSMNLLCHSYNYYG